MAKPVRPWTPRVSILAGCVFVWCNACAKPPSTEAPSSAGTDPSPALDGPDRGPPSEEDPERQKRLERCIDGCTKVQLENPEESPYDCRGQCEELLDSIREK